VKGGWGELVGSGHPFPGVRPPSLSGRYPGLNPDTTPPTVPFGPEGPTFRRSRAVHPFIDCITNTVFTHRRCVCPIQVTRRTRTRVGDVNAAAQRSVSNSFGSSASKTPSTGVSTVSRAPSWRSVKRRCGPKTAGTRGFGGGRNRPCEVLTAGYAIMNVVLFPVLTGTGVVSTGTQLQEL